MSRSLVQIQPGSCKLCGGGANGRRASLRHWFMRVRVPPSALSLSRCGGTLADTRARGARGANLLAGSTPAIGITRARVAQTADARSSNLRPLRVRISPLASVTQAGVAQLADADELKPHLLTVRLRPPASVDTRNVARSSKGQDAGPSSRRREFKSLTGCKIFSVRSFSQVEDAALSRQRPRVRIPHAPLSCWLWLNGKALRCERRNVGFNSH